MYCANCLSHYADRNGIVGEDKASQFIQAAGEWLSDNDGATADDPGYFDNQ